MYLTPRIKLLLAGPLAGLASTAAAHDPLTGNGQQQVATGLAAALLGACWFVYLTGSRKRPPGWRRTACWHTGMLVCVFAVFGPLDSWAEASPAAHMSQHMLMIMVIAPLWVASRPFGQLNAGGPGRVPALLWQKLLPLTRRPLLAAWLHGAVIWLWHTPRLYLLALESPWWHVFEHACFLLTAALFWWAVLKCSHRSAPWSLLAVLATLMHTGFLGALLTFAREPLYALVTPEPAQQLASQQLAGLIMWVAGGLPYLLAAAWITQRWYRQMTRRLAPSPRQLSPDHPAHLPPPTGVPTHAESN